MTASTRPPSSFWGTWFRRKCALLSHSFRSLSIWNHNTTLLLSRNATLPASDQARSASSTAGVAWKQPPSRRGDAAWMFGTLASSRLFWRKKIRCDGWAMSHRVVGVDAFRHRGRLSGWSLEDVYGAGALTARRTVLCALNGQRSGHWCMRVRNPTSPRSNPTRNASLTLQRRLQSSTSSKCIYAGPGLKAPNLSLHREARENDFRIRPTAFVQIAALVTAKI